MSGQRESLKCQTLHELPFREAFLAGIPDSMATVLRALGRWMYDELVDQGLMDPPSDPRTLLRRLRRDLQVVELGLGEIIRSVESELDQRDGELIAAARIFDVEVRDLASRMDAVAEACRPAALTMNRTEAAS